MLQDCFLAYPWNNMLHGLVESILRTVIDSDSEVLKKSVRAALLVHCLLIILDMSFAPFCCCCQLFQESKLVDTFIRGHKMNEEAA